MARIARRFHGLIGCRDLDDYRLMTRLAVEDKAAFGEHIYPGLDDGRCRRFQGGEKVTVEEHLPAEKVIRVRARGEAVAYWIGSHALR
jgi:hypothetical protein